MMWADNYWPFSDNREELICMVNDIIEELLDLDMEPKPESLWWTSTYKHEDMRTSRVWGGAGRRLGNSPSSKSLMYLDTVFRRDGKGFQGAERSMCKVLISWLRDTVHQPFQDCPHDDQMLARPQSCTAQS